MAVVTTPDEPRSIPRRPTTRAARTDPDTGSRLLERGRWRQADEWARVAIEDDPSAAPAWVTLAGAFAGRGWFDEAERCVAEAVGLGADEAEAHHQVGRATNRWALEDVPVVGAALVGLFVGLGLLAFAVALTMPFVVREVRLRRLPPIWRARAAQAWPSQGVLRYPAAAVVLLVVASWAVGGSTLG